MHHQVRAFFVGRSAFMSTRTVSLLMLGSSTPEASSSLVLTSALMSLRLSFQ